MFTGQLRIPRLLLGHTIPSTRCTRRSQRFSSRATCRTPNSARSALRDRRGVYSRATCWLSSAPLRIRITHGTCLRISASAENWISATSRPQLSNHNHHRHHRPQNHRQNQLQLQRRSPHKFTSPSASPLPDCTPGQ